MPCVPACVTGWGAGLLVMLALAAVAWGQTEREREVEAYL